MTLWLVRCGRHGEGENLALGGGVVGVGWPEVGDLGPVSDTGDIRELVREAYPDQKTSTVANWTAQLDAFRLKIALGDLVSLPLKTSPAVAFGRVTGAYKYEPGAPESMRHQRSVMWIREDVPRDAIDQDLRYSLGAFLTVCQVKRNDAEARITALLSGPARSTSGSGTPAAADGPVSEQAALINLGELSRDQIRQRLAARFQGHELARLVAELLAADGFVTDVSPAGPDGGVDILAGQGGMGFDGAMLAVQVKSGSGVVDAGTLRELQGVMANFGASRGLLVSWGGFTKTARAEARRLFFQIRLWDSDDVIAKVGHVYGRLSPEVQAELPLRRIWTLVAEDDN